MEEKTISLRVPVDVQNLIDRVADDLGKTRNEFMLEAARAAALNALPDRRLIQLDDEAWARFQAAMQTPPQPSAQLRRLMNEPSPWESA